MYTMEVFQLNPKNCRKLERRKHLTSFFRTLSESSENSITDQRRSPRTSHSHQSPSGRQFLGIVYFPYLGRIALVFFLVYIRLCVYFFFLSRTLKPRALSWASGTFQGCNGPIMFLKRCNDPWCAKERGPPLFRFWRFWILSRSAPLLRFFDNVCPSIGGRSGRHFWDFLLMI